MNSVPIRSFLAIAYLIAFFDPTLAQTQDDALIDWAAAAMTPIETTYSGASMTDLMRIGEIIGDARIVALSEAVHGAAEPLAFRNRVFRYLVEEKGFAAIAIESGTTESQVLQNYVLGDSGDIENVLASGFGWGFDVYPQNKELIEWMR